MTSKICKEQSMPHWPNCIGLTFSERIPNSIASKMTATASNAAAPARTTEESSKKGKTDPTATATATTAEPASPADDADGRVSTNNNKEEGTGNSGLGRPLSREISSDSLAYVDNYMRRNISKPSFAKTKTRRGGRRPTSNLTDDEDQDDDIVMVIDWERAETSDLDMNQQQGERPELGTQGSGIFF